MAQVFAILNKSQEDRATIHCLEGAGTIGAAGLKKSECDVSQTREQKAHVQFQRGVKRKLHEHEISRQNGEANPFKKEAAKLTKRRVTRQVAEATRSKEIIRGMRGEHKVFIQKGMKCSHIKVVNPFKRSGLVDSQIVLLDALDDCDVRPKSNMKDWDARVSKTVLWSVMLGKRVCTPQYLDSLPKDRLSCPTLKFEGIVFQMLRGLYLTDAFKSKHQAFSDMLWNISAGKYYGSKLQMLDWKTFQEWQGKPLLKPKCTRIDKLCDLWRFARAHVKCDMQRSCVISIQRVQVRGRPRRFLVE